MTMDIFSSNNIQLQFSATASDNEATDYLDVPELAAFPAVSFTNNTISVTEFSSQYQRKLSGSKSIDDVTLTCNWIPDNETFIAMDKAVDDQTRCQIKITYFTDATQTNGYAVVLNGFMVSNGISGDFDAVIQRAYTFTVDGAPVSAAVVTPVDPDGE